MRRYLVGGAVRDELLGLPIKERDWGRCRQHAPSKCSQLATWKKTVQFQVYLDPELGEEHSLARTETVSGSGHRGFVISYAPDISLEADLRRRDLTINAIAKSESGELIDPYGGCEDLRKRLLRHVSSAFADDPPTPFKNTPI